jgi:hypothetical protein
VKRTLQKSKKNFIDESCLLRHMMRRRWSEKGLPGADKEEKCPQIPRGFSLGQWITVLGESDCSNVEIREGSLPELEDLRRYLNAKSSACRMGVSHDILLASHVPSELRSSPTCPPASPEVTQQAVFIENA